MAEQVYQFELTGEEIEALLNNMRWVELGNQSQEDNEEEQEEESLEQ